VNRPRRSRSSRGQATLEMALILPVLLLIVLGTLEFGFVMDHKLTLQYASREAARVGSALSDGGGMPGCLTIDNEVIAAAARILQSSDSNIEIDQVSEIRIYEADLVGSETDGREDVGGAGDDASNVWVYNPGNGPMIDGVPLDFAPVLGSQDWDPCSERQNTGATPDSIGVSVTYTYFSRTPLAALINILDIGMYDFTVFELNPTNN
jgi:TadE-like protein